LAKIGKNIIFWNGYQKTVFSLGEIITRSLEKYKTGVKMGGVGID